MITAPLRLISHMDEKYTAPKKHPGRVSVTVVTLLGFNDSCVDSLLGRSIPQRQYAIGAGYRWNASHLQDDLQGFSMTNSET